MKTFISMVIALFIMALAAAASAEEHRLIWDAPIDRENGEAITLEDIDHFDIYNAADGTDVILDIPKNVTEIVHDFPFGPHRLVMTTTDIDGRESVYSNIVEISSAPKLRGTQTFRSERVQVTQ